MIGDVAKENNFQIVFCFGVTASPQRWSDAEQMVDRCQIKITYSAEFRGDTVHYTAERELHFVDCLLS